MVTKQIFASFLGFMLSLVSFICVIIFIVDITGKSFVRDFLWQQWFVAFFIFSVASGHTFLPLTSQTRAILPYLHTLAIAFSFNQVCDLSTLVIDCSAAVAIFKHKPDQLSQHCNYFDTGFAGFVIAMASHVVYLFSCIIFRTLSEPQKDTPEGGNVEAGFQRAVIRN
eukprot:Sdes_comp19217_c0_seq1m10107